jgi:hypothetical protein
MGRTPVENVLTWLWELSDGTRACLVEHAFGTTVGGLRGQTRARPAAPALRHDPAVDGDVNRTSRQRIGRLTAVHPEERNRTLHR